MPDGNLDTLLKVLEENGTLAEVSRFLEQRGLTHSASSWETMHEERLKPALQKQQLTDTDLLRLLGELEEHGHQHVFLYQLADEDIETLLAEENVTQGLEELSAINILENPIFLNKPDEPTIADVRREEGSFGEVLIVKVVETRIYTERIGRRNRGENVYDIRYRDHPARSVNVFRLHENGLLELRLEEHKNASRNYDEERQRMWDLLAPIFPRDLFHRISLSAAKYNIWEHRNSLQNIVRYSNSRFLDAEGNSVRAAAGGKTHNLAEDVAVVRSLDEFNRADTTCDTAVVWWLEQDGGPPSKDVRTRIAGERNEFSITAKCNREDYEYVLEQILSFN